MVLSRGEGFVLNARKSDRGRKMQVEAGDCAFMAGKFGACSVRECEGVPCSGFLGAVAGDDWALVTKDAMSVTEGKAGKTGVDGGLKERGDGELGELHFRVARDASGR